MTRKLAILDRFEHGTLVEVRPSPHYEDEGTANVYYVSEKARLDTGMQIVEEAGTFRQYLDEQTGVDQEGIREQVSATDLVERAEKRILDRTDGDIADNRGFGAGRYWWRSSSSRKEPIPAGVVKFSDCEADHEDAPRRSSKRRGYCWAAVQEHVLSEGTVQTLNYENDAQKSHTLSVRVPMCVVMAGDEMLAAYLAAHDHHEGRIARALGRDMDDVCEMIATVVDEK